MDKEELIIRKTYKNDSGDILIKASNSKWGCGIVEMLHLWDKETRGGCVIAFWKKTKSDGEYIAELTSVGSRLMDIEYDSGFDLISALKYGQKLADLIIESDNLAENEKLEQE